MPIYELKCQKCQTIEEHLLKFSDPKPTECQSCGGPLQQIISQTSFALKGSGWYVTDYKGGASASSAANSESNTPAEASSTSDKTPAPEAPKAASSGSGT